MVPRGGIEPPTRGFSILCSTTELPRHVCQFSGFFLEGKRNIHENALARTDEAFYTPPAFDLNMAKGKSVSYVWICQGSAEATDHGNHIGGSGWAQRDKLKDMKRNKYCPVLRQVASHVAKPVKKGGTKALAAMK